MRLFRIQKSRCNRAAWIPRSPPPYASKWSWEPTSFYIAGRQIVASPGAAVIGSPRVFWDIGLSHLNFEWRLLKVNDMLNASETSRQLLAHFEAGRLKGQAPLYIDPRPH
jgi:hypothetical protein